MLSFNPHNNAELHSLKQHYGEDPLADRETNLYRGEFVMGFVERWDELIDWDARAESESISCAPMAKRVFSTSPRAPASIPSV